jgi:methylenetetrahydrofolate reductase (NADPH)
MSFSQKLDQKKFVITSEVQVSAETDTESMLGGLNRIKGRIDGLIVTDAEIEGVACDSVQVCSALKEGGYNPLFETTTREKNRIELQTQLIKASDAGINSLLAFTRDYRITGDSLNEMMFFHVDSGKLFSVLQSLKEGVDVRGRSCKAPAHSPWGRV